MTPKVRALVGIMTTLVFLGLALMLTLEQRYAVAALLGVLGMFRAFVAFNQVRAAFGAENDDDDDDDDDDAP